MIPWTELANLALHLALSLLLAPLLPGIINRVKAWFAGRRGPPLLQGYYDLLKLWRKDAVYSRTTTWVFLAGPVASVATCLLALQLVPFGRHAAPLAFSGDLVLFAALLGLGRFLTACAALDTGSSFEGMGASREVTFSALAEPALFLGLAAVAKLSQSLSLGGMLEGAALSWSGHSGPLLLVLAGWSIVLLAENSRIPVDDPNTHLELTMIHEVMVLDHSGPALALVHYGAALKLLALGSLLVGLCLPGSGDPWLDWATFLGAIILLAALIGVVESVMARLRMPRVPQLLVAATLSCAFGFLLLLL